MRADGRVDCDFNPLNAKLNPICHLLALLAHHILHVGGLRVNITLQGCERIKNVCVLCRSC